MMDFSFGGDQRKSLFLNRKIKSVDFLCRLSIMQLYHKERKETADQGIRKGDLKPFWIRHQPLLRGQFIQAVKPRRIGTNNPK